MSGRNNYQFFAAPMNAAANKRLSTESELWDALALDQLRLDYQPQIDLSSGQVVAVEALVRWQYPQHGLIQPSDFIPVAEACGLILPLGNWVLLAACRQAKAWLDAGLALLCTLFMTATARIEERENIEYFGADYEVYMRQSKMFIPWVF